MSSIKSIVALTLSMMLIGCGDGDSEPNNKTDTNSGITNKPTPDNSPQLWSITPWKAEDVIAKMAKVDISNQYTETLNLCGVTNGHVIETKDLKVGFHKDNVTFNVNELKVAARMSQVALDEDISNTSLERVTNLNIDSSRKWIACYKDDKSLNGAALFPNGFEFSPRTLDTNSADFMSSYALAKHELFHVIQYALLPKPASGENQFTQYPRWFAEASAEFFAGKTELASPVMLVNFLMDVQETPFRVNNWQEEQIIHGGTSNRYANSMYRMYFTSFKYLIEKGLLFEHLVRLTKASSNIAAFDAEMAVIENELSLPTTYAKLKSSTSEYTKHIMLDWLKVNTISGIYSDDIADEVIGLFFSINNEIKERAIVNTQKNLYTLSSSIADGSYKVYAVTINDDIYGPVDVTVHNGTLKAIDFIGTTICTSDLCNTAN